MDEQFELPVEYKGKNILFKSVLVRYGFIYKFHVDVNGTIIIFEPDEEKNYRAIADPATVSNKKVDENLLKKIANVIEGLVK